MKRSGIKPGAKSVARGSTFKARTALARTAATKRRPISAASPEQRARVSGRGSIVSGEGPCDPAHLWPRGKGGCDDADCVVPLTRAEHRAFDDGLLDLLPHLIANACWPELAHMVSAHHADPLTMLQRLTGERHGPIRA